MEKIININFQGRVIPIEETAYNSLKQYIDSLRLHFANEESSDEIINDIENRIAELLNDRLKRGAQCIVGSDLDAVIDSIGRLEDIEAAEGETNNAQKSSNTPPESSSALKGRFYRNADDKVIAGVCSGIANRTGLDPVVVRVFFVLLMGALLPIYIILWIIVPSQSLHTHITKRLFRNPDDKIIGGVCGGLAAYFRLDSRVPRFLFVLPFFVSLVSRGIHLFLWHAYWSLGPRIFVGSVGSTMFILYIILWIAIPYASSAADKMEMRGEKVDMNSLKAATQAKATAAPAPPHYSSLGRVIGILFKAFFMFIAGVIALSLFGALIGLVFAGVVAFPFTDFIVDSWGQKMLALAGAILLLGIPLLALITWIVRRLTGIHSRRHYLGYIFASLWIIGFFISIVLTADFTKDFSSKSVVEEPFAVSQPSTGKLFINVGNGQFSSFYHFHSGWVGSWNWDEDGGPFRLVNKDSLMLNTVKVKVTQSADSLYHIYKERISRGNTSEVAKDLASRISFDISQQDSIINLPKGFAINSKDKFRNQQVMVMVEVPVGKKIQFNKNINGYNWFNINVQRQRNFYYERHWDNFYNYRSNQEYIMTASGLKKTGHQETVDLRRDEEDNDDGD